VKPMGVIKTPIQEDELHALGGLLGSAKDMLDELGPERTLAIFAQATGRLSVAVASAGHSFADLHLIVNGNIAHGAKEASDAVHAEQRKRAN